MYAFPFTDVLISCCLINCPLQLKKLVYVYLVRYAEEQQDLALLSISTFQRALKVVSVLFCFSFLMRSFLGMFFITFCFNVLLTPLGVLISAIRIFEDMLSYCFFSLWQEPNQFIRASALRVLSSIRVPIIVPIMMLAIKEAAADLSPYVRKTSAHAIQKLFRYTAAHLMLFLVASNTTLQIILWEASRECLI